eukprot:TRINITY_DN43240_c0_g1_i1.p1 TRINITY_DN43240_c0_g1~~TRINITY_DN43240_c0_g1_i1.p1  ORF type:complete len:498 (-),score=76.89 TRINITY_DN43240_c0_g1_i1:96-1484(-)
MPPKKRVQQQQKTVSSQPTLRRSAVPPTSPALPSAALPRRTRNAGAAAGTLQQPSRRPRARTTIERFVLPLTNPPALARAQESHTCGACLLAMDDEDGAHVGLVDNCAHVFHYQCMKRWAETENSCPQCKCRFFWLAAYDAPSSRGSTSSGKYCRTALDRVARRDQEGEEEDEFEDHQVCERCKEVGDETALLLCDGMNGTCNAAFHFACVGLPRVPHGSWFCPDCVERGFDTDAAGRRGNGACDVAPATQQATGAGTLFSTSSSHLPTNSDLAAAVRSGASSSLADDVAPVATGAIAVIPAESAASSPSASTAQIAQSPVLPSSSFGRGRGRGRGLLPAHLRLNALACVSPAVDVPVFVQPGRQGVCAARVDGTDSSGADSSIVADAGRVVASEPQGLFANFARRRQLKRGAVETEGDGGEASTGRRVVRGSNSAVGFIQLNPTYEDDFMGKTKPGETSKD